MKQLYLITLIIVCCVGKMRGQVNIPEPQCQQRSARAQKNEIIIDQKHKPDSLQNPFRINTVITTDRFRKRKHTRIYEKDGNRIVITTFTDGDSLQKQNVISVTQSNGGNNVNVVQSGHGNSISVSQYSLKKSIEFIQ